MNNVSLVGRLAGDPGLRYTGEGMAVANFVLAVNRPYSDENGGKEVDFIKVVAFGKLGEACAQHIKKGRLVGVGGSLRTSRRKGEDGRDRHRMEVSARSVEFLDGKRKDPEGGATPEDQSGVSQEDPSPAT